MFGLKMMGNYEQRKIDRFEGKNGLIVDTCAVSDSTQPFETAVQHSKYNSGKWIIVELYSTEEKAQTGHKKWVETMTAKKLPKSLTDVSTATIKTMFGIGDFVIEQWWFAKIQKWKINGNGD
jgi:hypothetical protein